MIIRSLKNKGVRHEIIVDDDFIFDGGYFEVTHNGYARYWNPRTNRKILLHRLIMKAEKGKNVDHINGNPMDNRKCNLRMATQRENTANRKKSSCNTSGFKGVTRRGSKWEASIKYKGKSIYLGTYDCPGCANTAYYLKAKKLFGEFANDGNQVL